nr:carboxypeptidase regulatory-like domain-containing protein [Pyrinomonadaceae bacterium]
FGISAGSDLPTIPSERTRPAHSIQLSYTWLITPTLINEAKVNYSNLDLAVRAIGDVYKRETYGFAYPQLYNDGTYANGIPDVTITGFAGFNGPSALQTSLFVDSTVSDNLTIIRGNHTLKTGVLFFRSTNDQNGVVTSVYTGVANFNPAGNPNSTGNAFADALLGNFRNYSEIQRPIPTFFITNQFETYLTDNWKAHPRLSLEYGVRYQHIKPLFAEADNLTNFDPALYDPARAVTLRPNGTIDLARGGNRFNGLIRAGNDTVPDGFPAEVQTVPSGAPRPLQPTANVFAPRVSFAYSPFADNRTAVRGGFGVFFDSVQGDLTQRIAQNPPYTNLAQFENGNLSNLSLNAAAPAPFGTIVAVDPNLKTPYTMNFSLSVQRELPRGFFLETAYVGNLGRHLLRRPDINQTSFAVLAQNAALPAAQRSSVNALRPYKGYSQILMSLSDANSNYNALQLYVAKRAGDLRLTGSYTFSKALTDASGSADNPEEPFNRRFNYGPATYNRPHIFVSTYTYSFRRRDSFGALGNALLGGWEVSGITRLQSGANLSVTGNSLIGGRRADYLGGSVLLPDGERGPNRWVNVAAFDEAPDARRGNAGVGIVSGPGLQVWDISLRRRFGLRENVNLQFQADLFNAFNRANFLNLSLNTSNADFGSITSSAPGRNIQFGLKLTF